MDFRSAQKPIVAAASLGPLGSNVHRHLESSEQDKRQFQNSRDYMVRIDDMLACRSCRKRFDIPSSQSVVFI